jgi:hypothetical protein
MVRGFLWLTFLAASAVSGENDAVARIAGIEARIGGRIGVAALDTNNSKRLDYRRRSDFRCAARSNFSLPLLC